jgi:dephospho-CoA kinase
MLKVGLTGSIAVGKSFVASVFAELGCHVSDADTIAREVVSAGTPGLNEVVRQFGKSVLLEDGTLNRPQLGSIIFTDPAKRALLNSILHPFIIERQDQLLQQWEAADPDGIGMIDAALMIESGGYQRFDKIVVVHCRPEIQLARLMERDHVTEAEAHRRIDAQLPQSEKIRYADFLIDTSAGLVDTRERTVAVYEQLRALSHGQP